MNAMVVAELSLIQLLSTDMVGIKVSTSSEKLTPSYTPNQSQ